MIVLAEWSSICVMSTHRARFYSESLPGAFGLLLSGRPHDLKSCLKAPGVGTSRMGVHPVIRCTAHIMIRYAAHVGMEA